MVGVKRKSRPLRARENEIITRALEERMAQLRKAAEGCVGSLYPAIYLQEADEIEVLLPRFAKPKR